MAAYFAFADDSAVTANRVAIWMLDREVFAQREIPQLELVDEDSLIRSNLRAIEQRALFLRVRSIERTVEQYLGNALFRFELPPDQREAAIAELDEMLVNHRMLFRSLDGAARTAIIRAAG